MRNKSPQSAPADRTAHPDNLLDLNRALQDYTYHPATQGEPPVKQPAREPEKPKKPWKRIISWIIALIVFIALAVGGWVGWKLFANQIKIFGWGSIIDAFQTTKLKGEDTGHVNILLAGNSADASGHAGAMLTDSIMVISLNTKDNTAFMFSIPRDLYVNVPGEGYAKINEAYQDGERRHFTEEGYADGGMGLLAKTVSEHFGIRLHYYALVDYAAVRDAVNAVGGITVTINSADPRGLYDPSPDLYNNYKPLVKLPNGQNTLNGVQALGLARARGQHWGSYGYALSDFERTKNQRLIMLGLKNKVLSVNTLANPVKLGELFDSLGNNVRTDLTLSEVRRAYDLVKNIPDNQITSVGLNDVEGENLLMSYITRTGQSALAPRKGLDDFSEIQSYIEKLLNPPTSTTPRQ
jgi:polyisoprenyl-teichoic acid--peptidoglycan teichoic acid transferase